MSVPIVDASVVNAAVVNAPVGDAPVDAPVDAPADAPAVDEPVVEIHTRIRAAIAKIHAGTLSPEIGSTEQQGLPTQSATTTPARGTAGGTMVREKSEDSNDSGISRGYYNGIGCSPVSAGCSPVSGGLSPVYPYSPVSVPSPTQYNSYSAEFNKVFVYSADGIPTLEEVKQESDSEEPKEKAPEDNMASTAQPELEQSAGETIPIGENGSGPSTDTESCSPNGPTPAPKVKKVSDAKNKTKLKKFSCRKCNISYFNKNEYREHHISHIPEHKRLFCTVCDFVTEHKHHMVYHIANHKQYKPYKCPHCTYDCINKSMITSHLKSHSNIYQYTCDDCQYAAKHCHTMKIHLRKMSHRAGMIYNQDGSSNPELTIDVYGKKRGPRTLRNNDYSIKQLFVPYVLNRNLPPLNTALYYYDNRTYAQAVATAKQLRGTTDGHDPNDNSTDGLDANVIAQYIVKCQQDVLNSCNAQNSAHIYYPPAMLKEAEIAKTQNSNNTSTETLNNGNAAAMQAEAIHFSQNNNKMNQGLNCIRVPTVNSGFRPVYQQPAFQPMQIDECRNIFNITPPMEVEPMQVEPLNLSLFNEPPATCPNVFTTPITSISPAGSLGSRCSESSRYSGFTKLAGKRKRKGTAVKLDKQIMIHESDEEL